MIQPELLLGKDFFWFNTNQGDIQVSGDIFAKQSNTYLSLFHQKSPSKIIHYSRLVQQETYEFLKFYIGRYENGYKNVYENDFENVYENDLEKAEKKENEAEEKEGIVFKYFQKKYMKEMFIEIYMFMKEWEIGEETQKEIIRTIGKNETTKEMKRIFNYLINNNIGVDIIENEVILPNIEIFLIQKETNNDIPSRSTSDSMVNQKDSHFKKENIYKMIINCRKSLAREEMIEIMKVLYLIHGEDILISCYDFIEMDNFSKWELIHILNIPTEEDEKKIKKDEITKKNESKEKTRNKKRKYSKQKYSEDLFLKVINIIHEEISKNLSLKKEKEILKEKFVDLKINELSTDAELFEFHEIFLKNRSMYQNYYLKIAGKEAEARQEEIENKIETEFQCSKVMIERGVKFGIPKMILKSIEEEADEKKLIQKCRSLLESQTISIFSLFKINLNIFMKEKQRLFEKINALIIQNITKKEDFIFLKLIMEQKNNDKLVEEKQIKTIIKKSKSVLFKLERIKIPKSVEMIGQSAFSNCSSLKEIELEEGIQKISELAFIWCSSLERIKIPKSVGTIGNMAFNFCMSLKQVELEEGIQTIGYKAFSGCIKLERIKIPKSVETISQSAFSGCSSLKEIELEEGIQRIEEKAFSGCKSLERIKIPKSVDMFGDGAFSLCSSLKEIKLEDGIIKINKGKLIEYKPTKQFSRTQIMNFFTIESD